MNFTIPRWLAKAVAVFVEWGNVRLIAGKRLDICRIDIITAAGGVTCVGYYSYYYGWLGAAAAAALYAACAALPFIFTI